MKNEIYKTSSGKVWLEDDGVLHVIVEGTITLEDGLQLEDSIYKAILGEKRPVLVDIREIKGVGLEARRATSYSKIFESVKAVAIFVKSPLSRFLGNFIIKVNKLPAPTKLFSSEDEALIWLKSYLK
jgi:hypothetical protein